MKEVMQLFDEQKGKCSCLIEGSGSEVGGATYAFGDAAHGGRMTESTFVILLTPNIGL